MEANQKENFEPFCRMEERKRKNGDKQRLFQKTRDSSDDGVSFRKVLIGSFLASHILPIVGEGAEVLCSRRRCSTAFYAHERQSKLRFIDCWNKTYQALWFRSQPLRSTKFQIIPPVSTFGTFAISVVTVDLVRDGFRYRYEMRVAPRIVFFRFHLHRHLSK